MSLRWAQRPCPPFSRCPAEALCAETPALFQGSAQAPIATACLPHAAVCHGLCCAPGCQTVQPVSVEAGRAVHNGTACRMGSGRMWGRTAATAAQSPLLGSTGGQPQQVEGMPMPGQRGQLRERQAGLGPLQMSRQAPPAASPTPAWTMVASQGSPSARLVCSGSLSSGSLLADAA